MIVFLLGFVYGGVATTQVAGSNSVAWLQGAELSDLGEVLCTRGLWALLLLSLLDLHNLVVLVVSVPHHLLIVRMPIELPS